MEERRKVIHDIKNTLTTIVTLAELLREEFPNSANAQLWLDIIEKSAEKCADDLDSLN